MNFPTMWLTGSKKSRNPQETFDIGKTLGSSLRLGQCLLFHGELGAGKTILIKGIIAAFSHIDPNTVTSPTYTYVNCYAGPVHHFDCYRIADAEAFCRKGLEEHLLCDALCLIEWPEKITSLLPPNAIHVAIQVLPNGERWVSF